MDTILRFVIWIAFGLVIGLIARAILPGKQNIGTIPTIIVGAIGALLGGSIAFYLLKLDVSSPFTIASIISSILGAIIVLVLYCLITRKNWK
ncbi:MAG: GlsB/YeaQ/YmgE family stress response membrane protein [Verrucomicrobiales bacterium]|nr:GlsB/YeaQ/YmgE family stress response membrane protein [Verrucomicrobiales bacterium]